MESRILTIFEWNGKDLFLIGADGNFVVLSRPKEVTADIVDFLDRGRSLNRKLKIDTNGKITIIKSPEEIENERQMRQRHTQILRDIAALEAPSVPTFLRHR